MAYELRWSHSALEDVEDIARYLAREAPFYAQAVVERIVAKAVASVDFPLSGRVVPEWNRPEYRETFVYSYRVIYRISGRAVIVAAIVHGSRRIGAEPVEREPR